MTIKAMPLDLKTAMLAMRVRPQQKSKALRLIRLQASRIRIASQSAMVHLTWMNSGATLMIV
jgi:hypothetical protein